MKVEYTNDDGRAPDRKRSTPRKKLRRRLKPAFFVFLAILVLGTLATLSFTVFFRIGSINVNSELYSSEEIITASGINIGDNMFRMSASKVEKRIETALPYVKNAKVSRKLPDSISIETEPATEYASVKCGEAYAVTDSDYKVLCLKDESPSGLLYIAGLSTEKPVTGSLLQLTDSSQSDVLKSLADLISEYSLGVTRIDVTDMLNISVVLENRLYVELGNQINLDKKLLHLSAMLEKIASDAEARITLSGWNETTKKATLVYEGIDKYIN